MASNIAYDVFFLGVSNAMDVADIMVAAIYDDVYPNIVPIAVRFPFMSTITDFSGVSYFIMRYLIINTGNLIGKVLKDKAVDSWDAQAMDTFVYVGKPYYLISGSKVSPW